MTAVQRKDSDALVGRQKQKKGTVSRLSSGKVDDTRVNQGCKESIEGVFEGVSEGVCEGVSEGVRGEIMEMS